MMKVISIQTSANQVHRATRVLAVAVLCALAVLCAVGSAAAQSPDSAASEDWISSIVSTYGMAILFALLLIGLLIFKRVVVTRKAGGAAVAEPQDRTSHPESTHLPMVNRTQEPHQNDRFARASSLPQPEGSQAQDELSGFGAYRIDQEVGKLILGRPYLMDVMASRAIDDRRAIEASLIKIVAASETDEDVRQRAQQALEDYGFVAWQGALLLLGRDAWERCSAARTLGQMGSESSLPFLIEALHDADPVVRNQAVASLGALKAPAAIGALLDLARRRTDIPASLLSDALSSCSIDSLSYLDSPSSETALPSDGALSQDVTDLESLVAFEDLPSGNDDATLTAILEQLESDNEDERVAAARQLAWHPVQRSVSALSSLALNEPDPAVRAAAVAGLGAIDHESVFAPVLIALSNESPEVRAAAARALTSLHFDRAGAYVRIMESGDVEILQAAARACIQTGIVAQTVDRLASEDRRQAYEAFSLFSLLAKANETEPILDLIQNHGDDEVRLRAVRALSATSQPEVAAKLRELVASDGLPETLRTAILELLYKLDQE